ncbi:hypothetical protein F4861DRAFT_279427 [Xylaria intraflava]|nr:hypothetical protein F4861DRAFT_279427 [Xylaria intraflava]
MPLQIPHPKTPLHLYRHLLRESTYLPGLCRQWIASRIQTRFRECRSRSPPTPYIKQAHGALRNMRSANAGHIQRLERLCYLATGRIGKRRRLLGTSMLKPQPPSDTAGLEQSRVEAVLSAAHQDPDASATSVSSKHTWLENWSFDTVAAIARSQLNQQARDWPHQMRRAIDPRKATSGQNCFGKPFRPKRVENNLKKHWAAVLAKLLPPLPQSEWDHLESLATGDTNVDALRIPPRRPVAQSIQDNTPDPASEEWDWSQHVTRPARVIERGSTRKMKSLTGDEDQDPRGSARPVGVYVITPRRLQRIYRRIWEMTPILKPKPGLKKPNVVWGQKELKVSPPSTRDLMFFQGVAEDGTAEDTKAA